MGRLEGIFGCLKRIGRINSALVLWGWPFWNCLWKPVDAYSHYFYDRQFLYKGQKFNLKNNCNEETSNSQESSWNRKC